MWLLSWLPDWIFHLVTFAGIFGVVASSVFSFIPFVRQYLIPVNYISVIILAFGLFMEGAIFNESAWRGKVKELEVKIAEAEAKSSRENIKIVEKIITKTKLVHVQGAEVIKYIDREIVKYDDKFSPGGQCEIPKEFFKALNNAAEDSRK